MLNSQAVHTLTVILIGIELQIYDVLKSKCIVLDEEVLHCHPCHLPHPDEDPQKEVCTRIDYLYDESMLRSS